MPRSSGDERGNPGSEVDCSKSSSTAGTHSSDPKGQAVQSSDHKRSRRKDGVSAKGKADCLADPSLTLARKPPPGNREGTASRTVPSSSSSQGAVSPPPPPSPTPPFPPDRSPSRNSTLDPAPSLSPSEYNSRSGNTDKQLTLSPTIVSHSDSLLMIESWHHQRDRFVAATDAMLDTMRMSRAQGSHDSLLNRDAAADLYPPTGSDQPPGTGSLVAHIADPSAQPADVAGPPPPLRPEGSRYTEHFVLPQSPKSPLPQTTLLRGVRLAPSDRLFFP